MHNYNTFRPAKTKYNDVFLFKLSLLLGNVPVNDAAEKMNIEINKLLSLCSRKKLSYAYKKANYHNPLTDNQKFFIRKNAGKISVNDMAKELDVTKSQIRNYASDNDFSVRMPSCKSVHASISDEDVRLMRELFEVHDISCAEIARKFDISHVHAWRICTMLSRTDVI